MGRGGWTECKKAKLDEPVSAMEGSAEFARDFFLISLELTIEVGQVPVSHCIGDRGNGLLWIQQEGACMADSQLSHVFDDVVLVCSLNRRCSELRLRAAVRINFATEISSR